MKGHPAKYSDVFIPIFAELLKGRKNVLDPMCGTGKIQEIRKHGFMGDIYCSDIMPEWFEHGGWCEYRVCDAENLCYLKNNQIDAICTSPTYGNRLADHHNAKDDSKRNSYTHNAGRHLDPENTGRMQWGEEYREKHRRIYNELSRVLKPNGLFILNISDHIRKGQVILVSEWHRWVLVNIGFKHTDTKQVKTPRLRYGANSNARVEYENIFVFEKTI